MGRMFVLTDEKVIEFRLSISEWAAPDDGADQSGELSFLPQEVAADVKAVPGGDRVPVQPGGGAAKKDEKGAEGESAGPAGVFVMENEFKLPPKEITFDDTSEAPDLILNFPRGGEVTIRFYDDTGREDWRRALAYYLATKADTSWSRNN